MQTTRTFIAVEVVDPARAVVLRLLKQLQHEVADVRWTQPNQLHITLKFLGDIDNRILPAVCTQLRSACQDVKPFTVCLQGLGAFPKAKPPRVLWLGVHTVTEQNTSRKPRINEPKDTGLSRPLQDPLAAIQERLENSLLELGVPRENRAYSPHLTLGRVNRGADQSQIAHRIGLDDGLPLAHFDVYQVAFIASIRDRNRMVYETIDSVEFDAT